MSGEDLQNMSVPKLRGYCRKEGVKGYAKLTDKEELLRLIRGESECGICLSDKNNKFFVTFPDCNHKLCFECAVTLIRKRSDCPFCRASFCEEQPNSEAVPKEDLPDEIIEEIVNSSIAHGMERYITDMFSGEETPFEDLIQVTSRRSASMVRQWYMD